MRTLRAIPSALSKGFSEWQTLLVLLFVTLLCGGIAVIPDLGLLIKYFGHAPLTEGKPLFSPPMLLQISRAYPRGATPLGSLNVAMLCALLLTLFVTGGVVWRSWTVDRFRMSEFIAESARMFGRTVRTLLWSFLLLLVCGGLIGGTAALLHLAHRDSFLTTPGTAWVLGSPVTGWALLHLLFVICMVALWRLTLDASRVLVLVDEMRKTRKAVWRAFRLVLRNPGAWASYALLGVLEVIAVYLVMVLHAVLPDGSTGWAWLSILVVQLVVLVRAGFQVSTTAFAADLVRRARATAAIPAPLPLTSPPADEAVTIPVIPVTTEGMADGESFEFLAPKAPARAGSTSEMPMVDADLVEDAPSGGGSSKS